MRVRTSLAIAAITAAPLALGALGLTHPADLTAQSAPYWRDLHIVLLPIFPLLGVNLWWLLAGLSNPVAWIGRVGGLLYITFYGALDALAGIGAGVVADGASREGQSELLAVNAWLFETANALAEVGVWAFLIGCLIASGLLIAGNGRRALPGAVLLVAAAVSFLGSHIYWPAGVLTMLAMAAGFGLLQLARLTHQPPPDAIPAV